MEFRKKPVVIEAIQWPGDKFEASPPEWLVKAMCVEPGTPGFLMRIGDKLVIETLEGQMWALPGDWIIRGVKGEIYPCKDDIFSMTYEDATPSPASTAGGRQSIRDDVDCQALLVDVMVAAKTGQSVDAVAAKVSALCDHIDTWAGRSAANMVVGKQPEIDAKTTETRMDSGFDGGGQVGRSAGDAVPAEWISVEDALPAIGVEVLVYRPRSERGKVTALARFISYEGSRNFYWDNAYPGKGNMHIEQAITHWRPMPTGPLDGAAPAPGNTAKPSGKEE
jgi:hypothetical protein